MLKFNKDKILWGITIGYIVIPIIIWNITWNNSIIAFIGTVILSYCGYKIYINNVSDTQKEVNNEIDYSFILNNTT